MAIDLGTGPVDAAQNTALGPQEFKQAQLKPYGDIGTQVAQNAIQEKRDTIRITPQIAEGLSSVTGDDSWKRSVGTEWKSALLLPILANQAQMAVKTRLESQRENYGLEKDKFDQWFKDAQSSKAQDAAQKRVETQQTGANEREKRKVDSKKKDGSTTKDLQAQKAILSEAHSKQALLSNPFADDKSKQEAQQWLQDNDADIKKAFDNMKKTAGAGSPVPQGTPPNSATDQTKPLNNNLQGLDPLGVR